MSQPSVGFLPSEKRSKSFNEVSLGYSKKIAIDESIRCPQCSDPVCMKGCPLGVNVPGFIRKLREGRSAQALSVIEESNCLPSICGRVCSAFCEIACVLSDEKAPIGIRTLERFVSDHGRGRKRQSARRQIKGKKIAIIGSGPAGLAAASQLADLGCQVTIFEALQKPGGVLRYGIAQFRLPKNVLDEDIQNIVNKGVVVKTNWVIGQTSTLTDLFEEGYCAVLVATGSGTPQLINLPGTNLGGVYYGDEFLIRSNMTKVDFFKRNIPTFILGQKIAVIGFGNTALDCARSVIRYGREVKIIFEKTEDDMSVDWQERVWAKEEGVEFESLVKPIEILADQGNCVNGIKCVRMDFAEDDVTKKWKLVPVPESEFVLDVDTVIIAAGHKPNALVSKLMKEIKLNKDDTIKVDENNTMTSMSGVFACGNAVSGGGSIIDAMAAGKQSARDINEYLK